MTRERLDIAFFGSSLVSAYWNGAATYYRGIVRALSDLGHRVTFYEPDAYDRQKHRDLADPPWARVVVYSADGEAGVYGALEQARAADVIIKASGVGVFEELLEREVLAARRPGKKAGFCDVDAPATLERVHANAADPFRPLVPQYDFVFTYGGGDPVVRDYLGLGARTCVPIYNALDPDTHHPAPPDPRFAADLSFLGNRLPDREARVDEFFFRPAAALAARSFLLAGNGWGDKAMPGNVKYLGHLYTADHNAFNCSALCVLNVHRESMARYGHSPATRFFEAAGAGACMITDALEGIDAFLEPGAEVLIARTGDEVAAHLAALTPERAAAIGRAGQARILAQHTYRHRGSELERLLLA